MKRFRTTWTHIRRSPYQALAAVSIMALTFFVTAIFVFLAAGSQAVLRYFETRPQATAFLKDETTPEQVGALESKLQTTGQVAETKYVSKEQALEVYREQNKNDPLLLEMVTADILPASLEVSAKDLNYLNGIADILKQDSGVSEVVIQEDVIASLKIWTNRLRLTGIAIIGFLWSVSFLIILVIIGMKVATHRKEIEVMQLIGATAWYIRAPFVFEGIFYGVVGAILAWGVTLVLILYTTPLLVDFLRGIPILPIPVWLILGLLGGELVSGAIIGTLGSFLVVKRYLH